MRALSTLVAIIKGKAIVLVKRDERKADVLVGREITKQFALSPAVRINHNNKFTGGKGLWVCRI